MAGKKDGRTPDNSGILGEFGSVEELAKSHANQRLELEKRKQQNLLLQSERDQLANMTNQYTELLARVQTGPGEASHQTMETNVPLTNADGEITEDSLKRFIEASQAPLQKAVSEFPNIVKAELQNFAKPFQVATEARNKFLSQEGVEEEFGTELPLLLQRNPQINAAFERMSSDPNTAEAAHAMVYRIWKAERPKASASVDESQKKAARGVGSTAEGPPMSLPKGDGTALTDEELFQRAAIAAESFDPADKMAFNRNFISEDTPLGKQLRFLKQVAEGHSGLDLGE